MRIIMILVITAFSLTVSAQKKPILKFGKYGCTASKYVNGSYEFIPRGSFTLAKTGEYVYNGMSKPSKGKFTLSGKGELNFKGGYFNGGKAEPSGRPDKFFVTFPSNPDNRWTCTCLNK